MDDQPEPAQLDLPSILATMSSGSSTRSSVRPSANSPGWMTNGSSSSMMTSSVRFDGRLAQVDRGRAMVVEDAEGVAQPQVDRGGLDAIRVPRVDRDPARLDEATDRAVGQDGLGRRVSTAASLPWDAVAMADDDDWVGEPPERRHSRDRAKPEVWRTQWQAIVATSILGVLIIIVVIIALLS